MKIDTFITESERFKCRKVADAFAELYVKVGDMVVADGGNAGYILLKYYNGRGFESVDIFTESTDLFEELWTEWLEHHLLTPVLGTPLSELDYEELYNMLPNEKQESFEREKQEFWKASFGDVPME